MAAGGVDERERRRAYRQVFSSEAGRVVLADIIYRSKLLSGDMTPTTTKTGAVSWSTASADQMTADAGRRSLALWILQQCFPEAMMAKRRKRVKPLSLE